MAEPECEDGPAPGWVCVCESEWDGCEPFVCVWDWLDDEGSGESEARIREPSESWLGADTTPPHQGLNLLRDQTHLRWARIIISSMGNFFITVTLQPVKYGHLWDIYWCIYHILWII